MCEFKQYYTMYFLFIIYLHSFLQTACVFQGEAVCRYGPDLVQGKITKMEGIGIILRHYKTHSYPV